LKWRVGSPRWKAPVQRAGAALFWKFRPDEKFSGFQAMSVGGARPGAGRPKGGANRINDEARRQALAGGQSPLDFLLSVMRDDDLPLERRVDAAKAAAPFVHAKLQALQHSGPDGAAIQLETQAKVIDVRGMTAEERATLKKALLVAKAQATRR
jgi:hypothetical protein